MATSRRLASDDEVDALIGRLRTAPAAEAQPASEEDIDGLIERLRTPAPPAPEASPQVRMGEMAPGMAQTIRPYSPALEQAKKRVGLAGMAQEAIFATPELQQRIQAGEGVGAVGPQILERIQEIGQQRKAAEVAQQRASVFDIIPAALRSSVIGQPFYQAGKLAAEAMPGAVPGEWEASARLGEERYPLPVAFGATALDLPVYKGGIGLGARAMKALRAGPRLATAGAHAIGFGGHQVAKTAVTDPRAFVERPLEVLEQTGRAALTGAVIPGLGKLAGRIGPKATTALGQLGRAVPEAVGMGATLGGVDVLTNLVLHGPEAAADWDKQIKHAVGMLLGFHAVPRVLPVLRNIRARIQKRAPTEPAPTAPDVKQAIDEALSGRARAAQAPPVMPPEMMKATELARPAPALPKPPASGREFNRQATRQRLEGMFEEAPPGEEVFIPARIDVTNRQGKQVSVFTDGILREMGARRVGGARQKWLPPAPPAEAPGVPIPPRPAIPAKPIPGLPTPPKAPRAVQEAAPEPPPEAAEARGGILTWVGEAVRPFATRLKAMGQRLPHGPAREALNEISNKGETYERERGAMASQLGDPLRTLLAKYETGFRRPGGPLALAGRVVKRGPIGARRRLAARADFDDFTDLLEGKRAPYSDVGRQALNFGRTATDRIASEMLQLEAEGRPVITMERTGRKRPWAPRQLYGTHMITRDFWRVLNAEGGTARIVNALLAKEKFATPEQKAVRRTSIEANLQWLKANRHRVPLAGHFQRAREALDLPDELRVGGRTVKVFDKSLEAFLRRYIPQAANVIALQQQFVPKHAELAARLQSLGIPIIETGEGVYTAEIGRQFGISTVSPKGVPTRHLLNALNKAEYWPEGREYEPFTGDEVAGRLTPERAVLAVDILSHRAQLSGIAPQALSNTPIVDETARVPTANEIVNQMISRASENKDAGIMAELYMQRVMGTERHVPLRPAQQLLNGITNWNIFSKLGRFVSAYMNATGGTVQQFAEAAGNDLPATTLRTIRYFGVPFTKFRQRAQAAAVESGAMRLMIENLPEEGTFARQAVDAQLMLHMFTGVEHGMNASANMNGVGNATAALRRLVRGKPTVGQRMLMVPLQIPAAIYPKAFRAQARRMLSNLKFSNKAISAMIRRERAAVARNPEHQISLSPEEARQAGYVFTELTQSKQTVSSKPSVWKNPFIRPFMTFRNVAYTLAHRFVNKAIVEAAYYDNYAPLVTALVGANLIGEGYQDLRNLMSGLPLFHRRPGWGRQDFDGITDGLDLGSRLFHRSLNNIVRAGTLGLLSDMRYWQETGDLAGAPARSLEVLATNIGRAARNVGDRGIGAMPEEAHRALADSFKRDFLTVQELEALVASFTGTDSPVNRSRRYRATRYAVETFRNDILKARSRTSVNGPISFTPTRRLWQQVVEHPTDAAGIADHYEKAVTELMKRDWERGKARTQVFGDLSRHAPLGGVFTDRKKMQQFFAGLTPEQVTGMLVMHDEYVAAIRGLIGRLDKPGAVLPHPGHAAKVKLWTRRAKEPHNVWKHIQDIDALLRRLEAAGEGQ